MNKPVKVLIVEDSEDDAKLALRALRGGGFDPTSRRVQTAADFETALAEGHWDAVISDYKMPGFTGLDALRIFRATGLDIPFILVSGTIGEETAVKAMKAGASDYVMKQSLARLAPALDRELEETQMRAALRRDQKDLSDSQERYRSLFEASIDAVLLTAPDGRILTANPSACRMFDLTEEEIRQGGRTRLVDASDPRLAVALEERSRTGRFMGELTFVRKDGTKFPGDMSTSAFVDKEGQPRTSMIIRDVTERKKDEQKFKDLLESAPDAMVIVNHDVEMVLVNAQVVKLFGWHREELLGQKIDMLVPERFRRKHPNNANDYFAQPRARAMGAGLDLFGLRRDGTEFPVEISLSPLETTAGTLVIAAIRDITERKLAEETRQLRAVELEESQRIARVGSWAWEIATGVVTWSEGMNHVLVRDRALPPPTFETLQQFYIPESWQRLGAAIANTIETGAPYDLELEMIRADGAACWTTTRGEAIRGVDGTVVKLRGTVHDITERKAAERRIAYLNRVYAVLSDINTLIVRVRERDELFKEACRIAVEKGGFHIALIAIVDRSTMTIAPVAWAGVDEKFLPLLKDRFSLIEGAPQGNPIMTRAINEKETVVINDSESNPDIVFRQRYAETGIRSLAVFPLIVADEAAGVLVLYAAESEFFYDEEMKLLTELAGDIAYAIDHIDKQERLDYLAYYDALTGLANRTLFLERVTQYIRSATSGGHKLAVFLIDLERFKNINDGLGRPAGDALLRQVADWLKRDSGDANLVARLDADHFATVLSVVHEQGDGAQLLEKTMQAFMDHPFRLNDAVFRVAAKVGVAVFPDDGANADTLFRHAEAALKKAKASGERYLFYTKAMTEAVEGILSLENQLRQALDNQEFVLHYQPKVNLASGKMTSAEALIRWNDPRTGLVPPGRFIPVLEETGLIYDVGRWALRQAIKDYLRWRAAGLPAVRIAVNVSPLQLRNRGFIDEIRQVIGIDAQAPAGLELEITESLIMEDVKGTIVSLGAICAMGVSIAIDDFGTGFSSLAYLARLPVDTLKIDRSFVIDMTAGPEGLALVSTIINLAHSLKLNVVAEGVETEEQSRLLRLLSCDEMQGFLFSKPVPAEIFETRFLAMPVVE